MNLKLFIPLLFFLNAVASAVHSSKNGFSYEKKYDEIDLRKLFSEKLHKTS